MANGNPFYVDPATSRGFAQGLGQLGTAFFQKQQQEQQKQQQQQQRQNTMSLLNQSFQAQDPQQRQELFLKAWESDPELIRGYMGELRAQQKSQSELQPEAITPYQQATIDFKKESNRLRELELDARNKEREAQKETNELKRQKLEAEAETARGKAAEQKQKIEAAESKKKQSATMAQEAASLAKEIANDPMLGSITGTIAPRVPSVRSESQDLVNKANRLQSMLTVDNLSLMSGVLTDRDIQFLTNVASGLNVTESGILGSEKAIKKRLVDIANRIESKVPSGATEQQSTQQTQSFNEGQTATNPSTGAKMIFRGGQWQAL